LRPPPLTPRSQRTFDNFNIRCVGCPQRGPPPPDRVVYQYFVQLPYPNSGGHLVGPRGSVAAEIRARSGVGNLLVLLREDSLAYVVLSGSRRAIRRALEVCKQFELSSGVHSYRSAWHRQQIQAAGTAWCEFDEANLTRVEGFALRDKFTDEAFDNGPHGGAWRPDNAHGRTWGQDKAQGDGAAAHERRTVSSARAHAPPPSAYHDRRLAPPERPALDAGSSLPHEHEPQEDRSRAESSHRSARRRSSRSASPSRRSERSHRSPSRSHGDRRSSQVAEPRWAPAPRPGTSGRSHHRAEPSTAALDAVVETEPLPSTLNVPCVPLSPLLLTSHMSLSMADSLALPTRSIPIAAIDRFVGPNAAGHFITQTTGVRFVIEAALEGVTLRLELGAGATSDSLGEARALVDKVLERSGLVAPPSAPREDAPRSSRDESQSRSRRASGEYERSGGRDRRGGSRSREGERVRDDERPDERRSRRGSGRHEESGKEKRRDSRKRDERVRPALLACSSTLTG